MEQVRYCPKCLQFVPLSDFRRYRRRRGEKEGRIAERCRACELNAELRKIYRRRREVRDRAREAARLARVPAGNDGD